MALIEARDHSVKVKTWRRGKTPNTHTAYVRCDLEILSGPNQGLTIDWTGWLTIKAKRQTSEGLMALGWTGLDFEKLPGLGSKRAIATVIHEVNETTGAKYAKAKWVRADNAGREVPKEDRLTLDELGDIADMMADAVHEVRAEAEFRRKAKPIDRTGEAPELREPWEGDPNAPEPDEGDIPAQ